MSRRIVDPIEYETKVSKENKELVKDFLFQKTSENRTDKTIKQYRDDMRIILTYLYRHFDNKSLLDLTKKDITRFLVMQKDRGVSPARQVRLLGTLRSALNCFEDDDEVDYIKNIAKKVKTPEKHPVREITFLLEEQVDWLIERLLEEGKILMAVYLKLTYISGKRRGELHQIKKEGLTERLYSNKVIGKGQKKKFRFYYDQPTQGLIKKYLEERGPDDIPELFVKCYKNGRKSLVNPATFNAWCEYFGKLLSEREGMKIHINPHCFRHTRIQNLRDSGVPLEKISKYVNHSSVGTTEMYLADTGEEDAADILGIDVSELGGRPSRQAEEKKPVPQPVVAPVPVMIDRTDQKQPVMKKGKKKTIEQLALF